MTKKLTGLNPLAYVGINAEKPSNLTMHDRNPTVNDYSGFELGDLWLYPVINRVFMLMDLTAGVATWLQFATAGGGDDVEGLVTDDALTSTPDVNGKITITGGSNLTTAQVSNSDLKVDLNDNVVISGDFTAGGTIDGDIITGDTINGDTITGGVITGNTVNIGSFGVGILQSDAAGVISSANGADGQVLIGGGTDPAWTNITQGAGVTITNAANSITIAATSGDNDLIAGSIIKYDGAIPGGASWFECDGSVKDQATYAALFARVGHDYLSPTFTLQAGHTFTGSINCVAHNGLAGADGLWVAVGANGELESSTDGITWVSRTSQFGTSIISCVAHNGLTGADGLWAAGGATAKLSTSPDGVTWTAQTSNFPGGMTILSIAHNGVSGVGGLWVAGGSSSYYSHSSDGITWVNHTTGTGTGHIKSIAYNNGIWLIGNGSGSAIYISHLDYSLTGTSWSSIYTQREAGSTSPGFTGIAYSPSLFIATSRGTATNAQSLISTDVVNWQEHPQILGNYYYPQCIGYGGGWFTIGTDTHGRLARSKDGKIWESLASPFSQGGWPPADSDSIRSINSNRYASPDTEWVAVASAKKIALGKASINTATHFYIPNMPGYIILY